MDGLRADIDLSPLIDLELFQVCIGKYQFTLNFDKNVSISIGCDCLYDSGGGEKLSISDYVENATLLCGLIGCAMSHATRTDDGGLLIKFSNGATLHLLNDTPYYEAFQLDIHGNLFVA